MSWRTVVISSTAKLDYQMGYLVIRKDDVTKIHLSEIENLMVESTDLQYRQCVCAESKAIFRYRGSERNL